MFSSQMAATSNTMATSICAAQSVLRPACRIPHHPRLGQTRAFRLNVWYSYLDPVLKKELQRPSRVSRRKYIETLNRKMLWDGHLTEYTTRQLQGLMCTALHRKDGTGRASRWSDFDIFGTREKSRRENEDGIEDVESDAVETLFSKYPESGFPRQTDRLDHYQQSSTEKDYEIDPITNRKVFKNPSIKAQATPTRVDNTQEHNVRRVQSNKANQPSNDTAETLSPLGSGMHYRSIIFPGPMFPSEADSPPNPQAPRPQAENTEPQRPTANDTFGPVKNTLKNSAAEPDHSGLESFDSKAHYDQPFTAYEPDGKPPSKDLPDPVEDGFRIYDAKLADKRKNHESDSMSSNPPPQRREKSKSTRVEKDHDLEAGLEKYDSKASYNKPFMAYEPDGQRSTENPEDVEQKGYEEYDRKHPYGPVFHNEPNGKSEEQVSGEDEGGWEIYDKKHSYGPVYHNEPDGKPEEQVSGEDEGGWEIYDKKHSYGPVYHNEPNGKPDENVCDPSQEDGWEVYDKKHPYGAVYHNEPDGKPLRTSTQFIDPVEKGLAEYDSRISYSPRPRSPKKSSRERASLGPWNKAYRDPFAARAKAYFDSLKKMKSLNTEKSVPDESTLEDSIQGRPSKITGNFSRDFPEEFQTTWGVGKSESLIPTTKSDQAVLESRVDNAEKAYIDGLAPSGSFSRKPDTPRLQPSLDRSSPKTAATISHDPSSEDHRPSYSPTRMQGEGELSESISSYGRLSLDTSGGSTEEVVTSSLSAEELEIERLRHEIQSIYGDSVASQESASSERSIPITNKQPTLYKILVYDPSMQTIDVAETTSIVADSSVPLTPSEVVLKLSNPAKFFPHFQPLQSEGYEIVSGSGDVLVFRKVRDGAPQGVTSEPLITSQDRQRFSTNPIDGMQSTPIATTGNFASPTGFVNHDLPTEPNAKPESMSDNDLEPQYRNRGLSERDLDFLRQTDGKWRKLSAQRDYERAERKKEGRKRRAQRVVLLGTGFAGVAYVVGVVQEYFKTGGIDGVGPQGL